MKKGLGPGSFVSRALNLISFLLLPLTMREAGLPMVSALIPLIPYYIGIAIMRGVRLRSPHYMGPLINITWSWIYVAIFIIMYMNALKWLILIPTIFAGLIMGIGDSVYLSLRTWESTAIMASSISIALSILRSYWLPLSISIASYAAAIISAILMRGTEAPRQKRIGISIIDAVGLGLSLGTGIVLFTGQPALYMAALASPLVLKRRMIVLILVAASIIAYAFSQALIGAALSGVAAWAYSGWVKASDLLPALKGEGSPRSRGLRPFHGRYSIMIHDKGEGLLYC
ncbi:MAG: hypothetical protein RXR16_04790 [Thermocladium sp.]